MQEGLARKLGEACGYEDWSLFLVNSGAEANENALKLASFHTGRDKVVAFHGAFHGRTSGAVAVTDNPKIQAPFNAHHKVAFATLNDLDSVERELRGGDVAAVILEAIQGVGGIRIATDEFLQGLRTLCTKYGTVLIMDEVQCGYGRTGWFFAHQQSGIVPDLVSVAKGMANGFPIGGVLISPQFQATKGMLGTTFGGNYLAMAGAHAVLDIIRKENLLENVSRTGAWLKANIPASPLIKEVRGEGLMLGIEFTQPVADIRKKLLFEKHIFTGVSGTSMIRLLAPLVLSVDDAAIFVQALKEVLNA